eukprot:5151876-Alexandrium_andersonii.AAC.1
MQDKEMLLGGTAIRREGGWPMGGPLSETATLVDLSRHIHEFYSDPRLGRRAGLAYGKLAPSAVLAGCCHVDDALALSGVLCTKCIEKGLERLLPRDLALE